MNRRLVRLIRHLLRQYLAAFTGCQPNRGNSKALLHTANNSLSRISSHAQYLLAKREAVASAGKEIDVIYCIDAETERAAVLLAVLPKKLRKTPIPAAADVSPCTVARNEKAQDMHHGKRQG